MLLSLIQLCLAASDNFYHFGLTFGQVFKDLKGSHYSAVNGNSKLDDYLDIYLTDRGAYFWSGNSTITFPPNDYINLSFLYPSTFTISLWIYSTEDFQTTTKQCIFFRSKDNSNFFYIARDPSQVCSLLKITSNGFDSGEHSGVSNLFSQCKS